MHWRRKRHPTPVFLPGESQGRGSLAGCRLWGRTELDTTEATWQQRGLLRWLIGKEYTCNAGDLGVIPGSGRYLGEGNSNPLQYFCLENPMERVAWWAAVHRVKRQTQLSD